jgi:hypothetical protein
LLRRHARREDESFFTVALWRFGERYLSDARFFQRVLLLARAHAAQIFAQRQMSMSRRRAACGLTECGRLRSGFGRAERFP